MIFHKKWVRPTVWEQMRINAMMKGGCILSIWRQDEKNNPTPPSGRLVPERGVIECNHITRANKRMGNTYTIPLRSWYHRGVVPYPAQSKAEARELYGAALTDGGKTFRASHGVDELELWQYLQRLLGMDAGLPPSKIVPRREASKTEALRLNTTGE